MTRTGIIAAFSRMKRLLLSKKAIVPAAAVLLYTLVGFFAVPPLLKRQLSNFAADQLQCGARIGQIRFNPFLFKLEINDFLLSGRDGKPIAGFHRFFADLELSGLLRRAWTLADLAVDALDVHVEIGRDGRLNLATLAARMSEPESKSKSSPRFLLRHVALTRGVLSFSDLSDPTPASVTVKPIDLELRDISTLPEHRGPYSISAALPGSGTLAWRGEISLSPVFSRGELSIQGFKIATVWKFFEDELNLTEPRGTLNVGAHYDFSYPRGGPAKLVADRMQLKLQGLVLAQHTAGQPLLTLDSAEIAGGRFDLAARELALPEVKIRHGSLNGIVQPSGTIDWGTLVKDGTAAEKKKTSVRDEKAGRWKVRLGHVGIEDIALDYRDGRRRVPLSLAVKSAGAVFSAAVETSAGATDAVVDDLAVSLSGVQLSDGRSGQPLLTAEAAALDGGSFDLGQRQIKVQRISLRGGATSIDREADGTINLIDALGAGGQNTPAGETGEAQAQKKEPSWDVGLDRFDAEGFRIALADRSISPAMGYDVENLRLGLENIHPGGKTPVKLEAQLRLAQGGSMRVAGELSQSGDRVAARFTLDHLNLKPLQPFLANRTRLSLDSADASAALRVDYRRRSARHELRIRGPASIDHLLLKDSASGERFLAWKTLATNRLAFSLAPDRLSVGEVRLVEPNAKIVIFKDRSTNIGQALSAPEGAAAPAVTRKQEPRVEDSAEQAKKFPMSIERVRVEKGTVEFADESLMLPFSAKIQEFEGEVSGLSSEQQARAAMRFEGRVDEYGLARVEGSLNPADPKADTDIRATFRNVEMSPLSPYSATFAGRKIASGKLALDLHYKIQNSELTADNGVALQNFTLGERVEAPNALNLPLDLAIALLSDANGRIDVSVPVRGNVDHPEFSYGHLVWQAIRNVIAKIVTAPFRALAGLFGGGSGENLDAIDFDPGRAVLLPPEREKLKNVATALAKRPQLKLILEGHYTDSDRRALQRMEAHRAVAAQLGRKTAGGDLGSPNLADAKTQRALEVVYIRRNSEPALAQFAGSVEKERNKPVQRVNPLLAFVGRASPDVAFYEALLKQVIDTTPVSNAALAELAGHRAQTVMEDLVGVQKVARERVEMKPATAGAAGTAETPKVKLAVGVASETEK